MQPPPQAVPSGMAGPPPAGNPQSMFWSGSPYRRQVHGSLPAAPAACPLQPVTDPFAFSRQALQSSPLGAASRGSPPVLPGPAPVAFPQRPGPPALPAGAGESTQSQPRPGAGPFSSVLAPTAAPGPEPNRSAEAAGCAEAEVQTPLPQYIPGPEGLPGGQPARPDPPLSGHSPYDGTASTASFPQPPPPVPGQWGPGQGGPPPSGQQYWPGPEGPVPSTAPQASGAPHLPPAPGPSYALHHPMATASLAGPLAGDPRGEAAPPQLGTPVVPAPTCRHKPGAGPSWAASELRPQPGAGQERWLAPLAPGSGPDGQPRVPPEAGSGALSMFFQGGEAENEENLSGRAGSAARQAEREPFPPGPGLGLRAQPGSSRPAGGPAQCENMENLEFAQNQEVPPSEPPGADLGPGEQLRFGPPGLRLAAVGLAGGSGPGLQAPDGAAAAAFGGRGRGGLPSAARPQDLGGTFIQQEVGKPGEEAPGSFFQQIDSSPLGGESAAAALALAQPATPSPPKPTGVFQTSANSSFEPVRSHAVGVRPVEADRANVVGEVRGPQARQRGHRPPASDAAPGNLEQPPDNMETLSPPALGPRPLETLLPTPERKASARVHGAVKCESPATTLWAQNELPDFGGNILLAPAAPALHVPVPARPPAAEVTQPPDEGAPPPPARPPAAGAPPPRSGEPTGASENLENPPELGEEEPLRPQASPGFASLFTPLPTAPPPGPPGCELAGSARCSAALASPGEKSQPHGEAVAGERAPRSGRAGEGAPSLLGSPLAGGPAQGGPARLAAASDAASSRPAAPPVQPPPRPAPRTSLPEGRPLAKAGTVAPEPAAGPGRLQADPPGPREETSGALDFTVRSSPEQPARTCSPAPAAGPASRLHTEAGQPRPAGPGGRDPEPFYQQVTRDAQEQQGPKAPFPEPPRAGSPPGPAQPLNSAQPPGSQAPTDPGQPLPPRPPRSSSASVASTSSSQAAVRPDPPWPQPLPPDYYYYHRALYDGYQPPYPAPYPPDPGAAASFYYQDPYGPFEPRFRHYDSAAAAYAENYRHAEPERPSSRASQCSDRPARREHPEGYYASKGSWSDYYGHYYAGQYDYGDLGRWERYQYGSGPRDPRAYDQRYWGDAEYDPCRRDSYAFGGRPEKSDDHWRYDPRFTGSFEDDPEPRRDPYGEEADRRSERSEHSAQSLRSRRSSLSAHSHQSQVYRSHHVATSAYEAPPPAGSFHGDYSYGTYGGAFGGAAAFPDFGVDAGWPAGEQVPSRPTSPEKFSVPHPCARFGPGGQLVKVVPNLPSEGQPALVEIHSMEMLLQHTPEQEEMRAFPGPLGKDDTHKVDVITFAQSKAAQCLQSRSSLDKESASLLWDFIVLLCRQNGTVVGTDIAELLLREHRTAWLPGKSPDEANLIDFSSEAAGPAVEEEEEESGEAQLSFLTSSPVAAASGDEKETERFRELLLYGRKKDALESAMKSALWGHALLLASKMDSRTHARVMTRFANSLPINDPLQTVYQLMSGRMPAASTCCGDEKWGDWRPHLAMVLSNLSNNVDVECRAMATMGDTLAAKGLLDAAHFCYLMAQASFGVYTRKTAKLVLIGSNHSLPFPKFATNEAIQRTEAYEYAQSLGAQACPLPTFQVFKFIYCCRLAEMGLATQAFHYCEVIAQSVLARPRLHSPVLVGQLVQMASQLRLFDPQLKEKPEAAALVEPEWLVRLRRVEQQVQEGGGPWSQDAAFPQQRPGTPSSELGQSDGLGPAPPAGLAPDNPLLAPPALGTEHLALGVQLLPSGPTVLPDGQPTVPTRVPMFPVMPSPGPAEPGPGYAPPGPALGCAETPGADPAALYPGPGLLPGAPPSRELGGHDAGAAPPEMPGGNLQPEPPDGDRGAGFATLGPSGLSPDSEAPLGWEPPPRPPTPAPETKKAGAAAKKEPREPKKSSEPWFFSRWLSGKKRTEAYLPDDKNKSIVWDEKRNRWVDVNEPEEEKTAPPPPPTALPKASQAAPPGPGGHPRASVNMFSRKAAGARARYVDVLNPEGSRRSEPALAPADFFAPLAPLPIPTHLLGPHPEPERGPSAEGASGEAQAPAAWEPKVPGPAAPPPRSELPPPGPDGSQGGEAPSGPPGAAVPFYNPAQFAPASGGVRTGALVRGGARR